MILNVLLSDIKVVVLFLLEMNVFVCFQSSQWGVFYLRHGLSEDVSRGTHRICPLTHKSYPKVCSCLWWSIGFGEKLAKAGFSLTRFVIFRGFSCAETPFVLFFFFSGKWSSSCSEKLLMRIQLWRHRWKMCRFSKCSLLLTADHLICLRFYAPIRHLKDTASTATCWASRCRPLRKDAVSPKSSWTQATVWQHTGNSEQGRCVFYRRVLQYEAQQDDLLWVQCSISSVEIQSCLLFSPSYFIPQPQPVHLVAEWQK